MNIGKIEVENDGIECVSGSEIAKERFLRSSHRETSTWIVPRFLDFHRLRVFEDSLYPRHVHRDYELILVVNGPYRCTLNGEAVRIEAGQVLLIQTGDEHQDHFCKSQMHYVVHFQLEGAWVGKSPLTIFAGSSRGMDRIPEGEFGDDIGLLEAIAAESTQNKWLADRIQDALLNMLFWKVIRALPRQGLDRGFRASVERQRFLEAFHDYIAEQIAQPLKVADVATGMNLPVRTLHQKVYRLTGESPAYWICRRKIDAAKTALLETRKSVKEIAYELGYSNPFHFSQVFKKATGVSPKMWRSGCAIDECARI